MKNRKSHFKFNKQERSGIFVLLALVVCLQLGWVLYQWSTDKPSQSFLREDAGMQAWVDSVKGAKSLADTISYTFNPNYISDYRGYMLGMSVTEIDRLHAYRASGAFVNSAREFQKVTGVSDSLLAAMEPQFRFPEWVQNAAPKTGNKKVSKAHGIDRRELNTATVTDLRKVNGVGEVLSARIIKFRDLLGGFVVPEQLFDVYGLDSVVAQRVLDDFVLQEVPSVQKVNLADATVAQLAAIVYLTHRQAEDIVAYRETHGGIASYGELTQIPGFPAEKIERIKLYLALHSQQVN